MDEGVQRMVALTDSVHAAWLLESYETMPESERSNRPMTKDKVRLKAALALIEAIEKYSTFPGDKELCDAADNLSTTQLWAYRSQGFTNANKKIWPLAAALGVDPKALIRGEVVKVETPVQLPTTPKPSKPAESDLIDQIRPFIGTPKEPLIREYLKALNASG